MVKGGDSPGKQNQETYSYINNIPLNTTHHQYNQMGKTKIGV